MEEVHSFETLVDIYLGIWHYHPTDCTPYHEDMQDELSLSNVSIYADSGWEPMRNRYTTFDMC